MIEISDLVKIEIREILDKHPGKILRIEVEGDGCAGPYFELSLVEADSTDNILDVNGIKLVVSEAVQRYSRVTTINLRINPAGKEF